MVSGLYQRRALGMLSHFVFGTAHKPGLELYVYAARWRWFGNHGPGPSESGRGGDATMSTSGEGSHADETMPVDPIPQSPQRPKTCQKAGLSV